MSEAPAAAVPPANETGVPPATQEKVAEEVPGFKVFAGNLAYTTTDEGLKAFFAPVKDDVLSAQVIQRGTRSSGYGFVALKTEAAANKAIELLDKQELDGRPVIVALAKTPDQKERRPRKTSKKRVNRRGDKAPPGEVTEEEANGEAEKPDPSAGVVALITDETAKPKKKKKNNSRKNKKRSVVAEGEETALIEGATPGEAAANEEKKSTAKAKVKKALRPKRPAGEDPVGEPSKSMLFVANLGFNVDDAALETLFKEAGIKVNSARIVRRRWGNPRRSKGYGFVDVGDEAEQKKAIEALHDKDINGRPIAVKVAVNSQNDEANGAVAAPEETPATVVAA
jgi:RNA recognition motif-containing protein